MSYDTLCSPPPSFNDEVCAEFSSVCFLSSKGCGHSSTFSYNMFYEDLQKKLLSTKRANLIMTKCHVQKLHPEIPSLTLLAIILFTRITVCMPRGCSFALVTST